MRLSIRCKNVRLTETVQERIRLRLESALARFRHRIHEVVTSVADLNGPKGGVDKQCRLIVRLRPKGKVTIEETGSSLFAAVTRAADRTRQAVRRALRRRRDEAARALKAKDIMRTATIAIAEDAPLEEALLKMRSARCLPVVRENVPIGIVSRHEVLLLLT